MSDDILIKISDKPVEVLEELFQSLLSKFQIGLKTLTKGSFIIIIIIIIITIIIAFIYCIKNDIKKISIEVDHIQTFLIG